MSTLPARQPRKRPKAPVQPDGACCSPGALPSLSLAEMETLAARLKALADPTRLGMLDLLAQQAEPLCVCDMTPRFEQNQPTISHHLKVLRGAGLIDCEKRGVWAFYWATPAGSQWLTLVKSARADAIE